MKKGFTCGVFDLFHAGHVLMLEECRAHCDYLIVALNTAENINPQINPGKNKPVFTIQERVKIMQAVRYVDEVLTYRSEEELLHILQTNNISIRFLGDDYKDRPITGADLNMEFYYTDRSHGLSTSGYIRRIRERFDGESKS
ncbi:MAG: adenylyltransferase/cytidyltransferase family protein [Bacteroidia bacterium]|jgi:glycerol-3-phosphate cytidylyltransferase|nr:adenylyltransferase/cytidyltransferase family protein [Bacteroidia bacterium]